MIRPVFTELALFATPFVLYALFLVATRAGVLDPKSSSLSALAWLTLAALAMVVASFVVLAQFIGSAPRSTYVPAHMENGRFVPGTTQ
ncbi:MAG: hypothetical protein HY056_12790 [Proteobacteria bacterium]|nr:hypothetical protein [Pseudomonadota bacterium]